MLSFLKDYIKKYIKCKTTGHIGTTVKTFTNSVNVPLEQEKNLQFSSEASEVTGFNCKEVYNSTIYKNSNTCDKRKFESPEITGK